MLIVGLTGGMGSGKSLISSVFKILGVPVFDADQEARILTETDPVIKNQLLQWLGPEYFSDGMLVRPKVAGMVFHDKEALNRLNGIVHPRVRDRFTTWSEYHRDKPYVIHEAAILFESGFYRTMDTNILIVCPEEIRVQRVARRDGTNEDQVRARLKNQLPDEQKIPLAGFIIKNDGKEPVVPAVLNIHTQLLKNSNGKV
ncbi:MAG: dephospho-CoA kinase [Bacteroidetes bacterium GWF2_49_14]|nr:MAG: dephospho-CoA kinase [Bacteroidetes bacterium GWF2_49_14]HBB93613.1 dephospho-CoA kinase [Bacteroidales bacterium]